MARIVHRPTGWNTWDFRGFNRLVFLRGGATEITIQYAIWDEHVPPPTPDSRQLGKLHDTFRWSDVRVLGEHAPLGLPAVLTFTAGGTDYRAEAVERDGGLRLTVMPLAETKHRVVFMLVSPHGESPAITAHGSTFAGWRIDFDGAGWPRDYFLNIAEPYAVGEPGRPATIAVRPARGPAAVPSESAPVRSMSGDGAMVDAPSAMMQAICWNTLYDTRRRLVSSPVSRDWCYDWKGVLVFCWDTFFVGAMTAAESPQLARLNFEAVTAAIDELGQVPNYYMAHGAVSKDRSMPPLGGWMIWKTQALAPDLDWLRPTYARLRKWHAWWMKHRDGNGDGLLEWGSDPVPRYEFPQLLPYNPSLQYTAKCAMYESGLDNSPMYDDVPFSRQAERGTFELADVALNSYYAMECEGLAAMADALGRPKEAQAYRREWEEMRRRVNATLWDESRGIYANRHWDGRFSDRISPTSFFPLIAGLASREQAERLIREHLLNEAEFWGTYVVPAIARSDPAFGDNDYWRGRIWGPFNFLVAEGLRRYRFDREASELARKGLDMFMANWRKDGGVYENYNAVTGEGGDVWNAARLYHWGGLMVYIALGEFIDLEPAGWLRIGSLEFPDAAVRDVHVGPDRYDIELGAGVRVRRNGELFLESTSRAIVRLPLGSAADRQVEITAAGAGRVELRGAGMVTSRSARINVAGEIAPQLEGDALVYRWK